MKQFKILTILFVALLTFNCSSDDDGPAPEPTTHQLLMSGKWFFSSVTEQSLDHCQKQTYYDFLDEDTLMAEGFVTGDSDECESSGVEVAKYKLIDEDKNIHISIDDEVVIFSIDFISESKLILTSSGNTVSLVKNH